MSDYALFESMERLPDGSWHPEDIKAYIRKQNLTLSDIAAKANVKPAQLSSALREPRKKAEIIIADALDVPVQLLFPTRWTVDGRRVRPRYADNYTTVAEQLS